MSHSPKSTSKLPPASEIPAPAAAPPSPAEDRREDTASAFSVIRLEDLHETDRLLADLVSVYRPANSEEMAALQSMAIARQSILRTYRLEAGLCASAMNEFCDGRGDLTLIMNAQFVGDGDIQITHAQNRNLAFAEGFQRMVSRSDVWTVFLRYQAQAERNYRRAVEEYERVRKLRGHLSDEPDAPPPKPPHAAPPLPGPRPPAPGPASQASPAPDSVSEAGPAAPRARRRAVHRPASFAGSRQAIAKVVLLLIFWSLALLQLEPPAAALPLPSVRPRAAARRRTAVSTPRPPHPAERIHSNRTLPLSP